MRAGEFLRRVQATGRRNGVVVRLVVWQGKGSHARLYYGTRYTTLKDGNKEVPSWLLSGMLRSGMLRDLGLTKSDIGM